MNTYHTQDSDHQDYGEQYRQFAIHYVRCRNAKKAAIEAGFDADKAEDIGRWLLKIDHVKDLIKEREEELKNAELAVKRQCGPTYVMKKLREIADNEENPAAARVNALKLLGSLAGMWDTQETGKSATPTIKIIAGLEQPRPKEDLASQLEDEKPEIKLAPPVSIPIKKIFVKEEDDETSV